MIKKRNDLYGEYLVKKFNEHYSKLQHIAEIEKEKCQIHKAIENLGYKYAEQSVAKSNLLPIHNIVSGASAGANTHCAAAHALDTVVIPH